MRARGSSADVVITIAFLVLAVAVLLQARDWPFRGALFPLAAGWVMLAAASLNLAALLFGGRQRAEAPGPGPHEAELSEPDTVFSAATRAEWARAIGWMGVFFVMLWLLGASVAIPIFTTVYLLLASRESLPFALGYALVCWLFVYGLFDRVLHIPLPGGVLLPFGFGF